MLSRTNSNGLLVFFKFMFNFDWTKKKRKFSGIMLLRIIISRLFSPKEWKSCKSQHFQKKQKAVMK